MRARAMAGLLVVASMSGVTQLAAAGEQWQYSGRVNAWFPEISGETALPLEQDVSIEVNDILDSLEFAFMGSLEARKGRWGVYGDFMYSSIGDSADKLRERAIGPGGHPLALEASIGLDVDTYFVTAAAYYRLVDAGSLTLDLLVGTRYIDVEQSLEWDLSGSIGELPLPEQSGRARVEVDNWDALLGIRGRLPLGEGSPWLIPYYIDLGAGDSDFTWQVSTGVGYQMDSWGMALTWRYLSYDLDSGSALADLELSGPAVVFEVGW